jgi:hypothetical protein
LEIPNGRLYTEERGYSGKMILKYILRKAFGRVDWICLAENGDKWQAFVNKAKNLQVP